MADRTFLDWPFFDPRHREVAGELEDWARANLPVDHQDVDAACRNQVAMLGRGGWLTHSAAAEGETAGCAYAVPDPRDAGAA